MADFMGSVAATARRKNPRGTPPCLQYHAMNEDHPVPWSMRGHCLHCGEDFGQLCDGVIDGPRLKSGMQPEATRLKAGMTAGEELEVPKMWVVRIHCPKCNSLVDKFERLEPWMTRPPFKRGKRKKPGQRILL